jgi:polar amino acid transport system ATP-binding protein
MRSLTGLGHKLMSMIARGLLLDDSYFVDRYTGSPSTSLRIFNYPRVAETRAGSNHWASGSRTEQGLLTILKQDSIGGLEVRFQDRWLAVPDIPNSFVCIVGETLARLTNGRFVSAAHRVRSSTQGHRVAMPFCFDPRINSVIEPILTVARAASRTQLADEIAMSLPELGDRNLA